MGCINLAMGKSRLYGIGNLIWRSGISISSELLTMQRQWNSTRRTNLCYGRKRTGKEENGEGGESNREGDQVDAEEERDDQEDDQAHGKDGTESESKEQREAAY